MENKNLIISNALSSHTMCRTNKKIRAKYYYALEYFISKYSKKNEYVLERLKKYRLLLIGSESFAEYENKIDKTIRSVVNNRLMPWRRKYRYLMVCDFFLILVEESMVSKTFESLKKHLSKKQCILMDNFYQNIINNQKKSSERKYAGDLLEQLQKNSNFIKMPENRFLITANVSAGKSTLINAIVGKKVAKTAQEVCTENLCYFYNKPFEDETVHLVTDRINLDATYDDLIVHSGKEKKSVAAYFRTAVPPQSRICIIDTPGVNSSIYLNHGEITRKTLTQENYDTLIYIFNANRLGTDEEITYLKYIFKYVLKKNIIFVLNKLDDYKTSDDSIELSIEGLKNDLQKIGFNKPVICPISAYFAFLLKKKQNGESLTEDEQDYFDLYARKLMKPAYDLSRYYKKSDAVKYSDKEKLLLLNIKCGLHGLEATLFGD